MYLYVLKPNATDLCQAFNGNNSNSSCLYDDDSGQGLQPFIEIDITSGQELIIFACRYNPSGGVAEFSIINEIV